MISNNTSTCQDCGGKLKYYDKVRRIVRTKGRVSKWVNVPRYQCSECRCIHRYLPDYIYPYKQYESEIIAGVIEGLITCETFGYDDYPCEMRIEENKSVWDADEKYNRRMMDGESVTKDNDFKERQIAEQIKDRYFRVGIAAAELLIPLMCYGIWMNKGFKFEETGTFTSSTFKGLINRFRPTKK